MKNSHVPGNIWWKTWKSLENFTFFFCRRILSWWVGPRPILKGRSIKGFAWRPLYTPTKKNTSSRFSDKWVPHLRNTKRYLNNKGGLKHCLCVDQPFLGGRGVNSQIPNPGRRGWIHHLLVPPLLRASGLKSWFCPTQSWTSSRDVDSRYEKEPKTS